MGLFKKKPKKEDVQAEVEAAKKEAENAKKALKDMMDKKVEEKQAQDAAEKKVVELESKLKEVTESQQREKLAEARQKALEERRAKLESEKKEVVEEKVEVKTTHTVAAGETLSDLALKYYKHATPPYWKYLLEHNTEVLKGNERNLRTGMVIEIPELPEELKD